MTLFPSFATRLLSALVVLLLSSPALFLPIEAVSSSSYATVLFWSVCHYAGSSSLVTNNLTGSTAPQWSVVTSAAMVTSPLQGKSGSQYITVLSITGTRTYTTIDPVTLITNSSQALITALLPTNTLNLTVPAQGAYVLANQTTWVINTNQLNLAYPQLPTSAGGMAYALDRNITTPTGLNTSTIFLYGDPPLEYPTNSSSTGISYFVFQSSQSNVPMQCPPPNSVTYAFSYVATPINVQGTQVVGSTVTPAYNVWSACVTGNLTLIGPYALPAISQAGRYAYIALSATGTRTFVNATASQVANIIGVSAQDYGDFSVYLTATGQPSVPVVSYAGITLTLDQPTMVAAGQFPGPSGANYINVWAPTAGDLVKEYIVVHPQPVQADNIVQFKITPWVNGVTRNFVCPVQILTQQFYFCHIATSDPSSGLSWTVVTTGLFYTNLLLSNGSRQITAITGVRTQWNGDGTNSTVNITLINKNNQMNYITNQFPMFDTLRGVTFQLSSAIYLPGFTTNTTLIGWIGQPVVEANGSFVRVNYTAYSSFIWQNVTQGPLGCTPPVTPATLAAKTGPSHAAVPPSSTNYLALPNTAQYSFYYVAEPVTSTWLDSSLGSVSSCMSGILQLSGPFNVPSASGTSSVYTVGGVSGERVFLGGDGSVSISTIVGLASNVQVNTTDNSLQAAAPFLSAGGIAFVMSSTVWTEAGDSGSTFIRLYSQSLNASSNTTTVLEGVPFSFSVSSSPVLFHFAAYDPAVGLFQCLRPGEPLALHAVAGGYVVLALVLALIALMAGLSTLSRLSGAVRHAQPFRAVLYLLASAVLIGPFSVWAEYLLLFSQVDVSCDTVNCVSSFPVDLSVSWQVAALALIPSFVFTLLAFLMWSMQRRSSRVVSSITAKEREAESSSRSATHASSTIITALHSRTELDQAQKRQWRVSSWWWAGCVSCWTSMKVGFSLYMSVVVTLMAAGLVLTRVTLSYALVTNATITMSPAAAVLSAVLTWLLCFPSILLLVSGRRFEQVVACLILVLTVMIDFFICETTASVAFTPAHPLAVEATTSLLYTSALLLSPSGVAILCGSLGGFCLLVWLVFQWRAIAASRHALVKAVKSSRAQVSSLGERNYLLQQQLAFVTAVAEEQACQTDILNLLRPVAQGTAAHGGILASLCTPLLFALNANDPAYSILHSPPQTLSAQRMSTLTPRVDGSAGSTSVVTPPPAAVPRILVPSDWKDRKQRDSDFVRQLEANGGAASKWTSNTSPNTVPNLAFLTTTVNLPSQLTAAAELNANADQLLVTAMLGKNSQSPAQDSVLGDSYTPALTDVLEHPVAFELLKDFMLTSLCLENCLFLTAVQRYKRLTHKRLRVTFAVWMRHEFIEEGSASQVNIGSTLRKSLLKTISSSSSDLPLALFATAEKEVKGLIETNNWKSFKASPQYTLCNIVLRRSAYFNSSLAQACTSALINYKGEEQVTSAESSVLSQPRDSAWDDQDGDLHRDSVDDVDSQELSQAYDKMGRDTPTLIQLPLSPGGGALSSRASSFASTAREESGAQARGGGAAAVQRGAATSSFVNTLLEDPEQLVDADGGVEQGRQTESN